MAKIIRFFKDKNSASKFIKSARERFKCITYGCAYTAGNHYHAMLAGDFTPEVVEQLKGRSEKGFKFEP